MIKGNKKMREKRGTGIDRLINTNSRTHTHTHTHIHTQTHAYTHKERGSDSVVTSKSDKSTKIDTNKKKIEMIKQIQIKISLNI